MKKNLLVALIAFSLPVVTILIVKYCVPTPHKEAVVKHHTEDMEPVNASPNCIQITFNDSIDGRATYNVLLSDSTMLESMYAEEIAHGLNTGKWNYNEMWTIEERP